MRVAALISGGKDSSLALYRALKEGHKVEYLVTMIPKREDSWMFHYPNIHLTTFFAESVGIPLVRGETVGIKEAELEDLKRLLASLDVEGVVYGAVSSQYQKKSIDGICRGLNLKPIAPLWGENPLKLLEEIVRLDFEVVIVGVYAYGFDEGWLGRKIDQKTVEDLVELNRRYQVSLVGEGGEYESLVLDAPFFRKRIRILQAEKFWENHSGCLLVRKAELVDKRPRRRQKLTSYRDLDKRMLRP